jgi:hypothetical protein
MSSQRISSDIKPKKTNTSFQCTKLQYSHSLLYTHGNDYTMWNLSSPRVTQLMVQTKLLSRASVEQERDMDPVATYCPEDYTLVCQKGYLPAISN